ncbi:putative capsular polysaccharide synthesis family protein [uncultured Ilyobacter sp.]|uniref:putative capsular polysaccharide synthesis family protein n=1 Tax=uncultured Ilyobacter sp. TaxID=544433 RepID=UPI0029C08291|nr:putative capsular polysaccharide synthesis family protein [uncultured Ilyobacter sp.]
MKKIMKKLKKLKSTLLSKEIILIYQMGKVGSTTIEKSLEKLGKNNVYHIHHFFKEPSLENIKINSNLKLFIKSNRENIFFKLKRLTLYIFCRIKKVKIITLTREPIERNISMFFQDFPQVLYENYFINPRRNEMTQNQIFKLFEENFNHELPLRWFDEEIKRYFSVDIYNYPFDKESGYSIIKESNIDMFVCKLEKLNFLENELKEFLELDEFKLEDSNSSRVKWYYYLYKEFKKNYIPNKHYLNSMYNSRFINHFYTVEEIEIFKKKWGN